MYDAFSRLTPIARPGTFPTLENWKRGSTLNTHCAPQFSTKMAVSATINIDMF
ncbi:hypothetical protein PF003_g8538 [Phytophthora fragariae]|nr:hypothetical protein PF003_g8538 [Phytophthora fragariae]